MTTERTPSLSSIPTNNYATIQPTNSFPDNPYSFTESSQLPSGVYKHGALVSSYEINNNKNDVSLGKACLECCECCGTFMEIFLCCCICFECLSLCK